MSRLRSYHRKKKILYTRGFWHDLGATIWGPPDETCPKCKNTGTEFYDPFFFSPIRTLSGKRRIKCPKCGFIWRPSRSKNSIIRKFNPHI